MNRLLKLAAVPFVALVSAHVYAEETASPPVEPDYRYFYVGAGIADVEPSLWVDTGNNCYYYYCGYAVRGDSDVGFTLTGGWRFHRWMALEASYVYGGNTGYSNYFVYQPDLLGSYDVHADIDFQSLDLDLVGILEGPRWDIYMKGGVAWYDAQSWQRLVEFPTGATVLRTIDRQDWSYAFAVGGGFRFGDGRYRLRLEYKIVSISPKLLGEPTGDASMGIADLQLQVRLGP